jgi:hypothetical protein
MIKESCESCIFYKSIYKGDGFCRRYPPKSRVYDDGGVFPIVYPSDWCGEYKNKQSKQMLVEG